MHSYVSVDKAGVDPRTFLQKLKTATAGKHRQLEQAELSRKLLQSNLQHADYIKYLQVLLPVVRYTESFIFPKISAFIKDVESRSKSKLIENDLQTVANASADTNITYKPFPTSLTPEIYALSHFYVMEGSTLGGKIIGRHVFTELGFNPTNGASYFAVYGDQIGLMWKSFLDQFSNHVLTNQWEDKIIQAVNEVYDSLIFHFEKHRLNEF